MGILSHVCTTAPHKFVRVSHSLGRLLARRVALGNSKLLIYSFFLLSANKSSFDLCSPLLYSSSCGVLYKNKPCPKQPFFYFLIKSCLICSPGQTFYDCWQIYIILNIRIVSCLFCKHIPSFPYCGFQPILSADSVDWLTGFDHTPHMESLPLCALWAIPQRLSCQSRIPPSSLHPCFYSPIALVNMINSRLVSSSPPLF